MNSLETDLRNDHETEERPGMPSMSSPQYEGEDLSRVFNPPEAETELSTEFAKEIERMNLETEAIEARIAFKAAQKKLQETIKKEHEHDNALSMKSKTERAREYRKAEDIKYSIFIEEARAEAFSRCLARSRPGSRRRLQEAMKKWYEHDNAISTKSNTERARKKREAEDIEYSLFIEEARAAAVSRCLAIAMSITLLQSLETKNDGDVHDARDEKIAIADEDSRDAAAKKDEDVGVRVRKSDELDLQMKMMTKRRRAKTNAKKGMRRKLSKRESFCLSETTPDEKNDRDVYDARDERIAIADKESRGVIAKIGLRVRKSDELDLQMETMTKRRTSKNNAKKRMRTTPYERFRRRERWRRLIEGFSCFTAKNPGVC